jgi:hypothetical protein
VRKKKGSEEADGDTAEEDPGEWVEKEFHDVSRYAWLLIRVLLGVTGLSRLHLTSFEVLANSHRRSGRRLEQ